MNRSHKRTNRKSKRSLRRVNRKRGGGFATTSSLMQFNPSDDTQFSIKTPVYQSYSDCQDVARPGAIATPAAPELAQTVMAGGGCGCSMRAGGSRKRGARRNVKRGGAGCGMRGGAGCGMRGGAGCGMRGGAGCGMRGGAGCGMRGGAGCGMRGGGTNGFAVQPDNSVGGNGPIAAPVYAGVPCDARAGFPNPYNPSFVNPDVRAPTDLYSITANTPAQKGGAGNMFMEECYRPPNSSIPVYQAESAGFHFRPSTEFGAALPDGVVAYNDVVPHAARLGGGLTRRRRNNKKNTRRRH